MKNSRLALCVILISTACLGCFDFSSLDDGPEEKKQVIKTKKKPVASSLMYCDYLDKDKKMCEIYTEVTGNSKVQLPCRSISVEITCVMKPVEFQIAKKEEPSLKHGGKLGTLPTAVAKPVKLKGPQAMTCTKKPNNQCSLFSSALNKTLTLPCNSLPQGFSCN